MKHLNIMEPFDDQHVYTYLYSSSLYRHLVNRKCGSLKNLRLSSGVLFKALGDM